MVNTKRHFHADEKLFELFRIKNDFAKYFAKFHNLSIILFHTLWLFLEMIHFYITGEIKIPCVAFYEVLFKNYVYKTFAW